jgi:SAM-dependent methyltransferase
MKKEIIEFGKRMDTAEDKKTLVEYAEGATSVLDLGAGTGKIARDIAAAYGAHVDAVDIQFKDNCTDTELVRYYGIGIKEFLQNAVELHACKTKYDCIVLSAILHELGQEDLNALQYYLPKLMMDNCRVLIREPFYDSVLGPVLPEDADEFIELTSTNISAKKAFEFVQTPKLSSGIALDAQKFGSAKDYANLSFTLSYGEQSWEREKHELRYARSLDWCKAFFNFAYRPFTAFQVLPTLDKTYKQHFINVGLPARAFDLIQYTGMLVVIDYSK